MDAKLYYTKVIEGCNEFVIFTIASSIIEANRNINKSILENKLITDKRPRNVDCCETNTYVEQTRSWVDSYPGD